MAYKIVNLLEYPQDSGVVLGWLESEWENRPIYKWMRSVCNGLCITSRYPQMFVAYSNDQPVGVIALLLDDMDEAASENPWLGLLYVVPPFRGKGIGISLFDYCEQYARESGEEELFLFTSNIQALAASRGWKVIRSLFFEGDDVVVMKKAFSSS